MAAARVLRWVIDKGQSLDSGFDQIDDSFQGNYSELKEISFGGCRYYGYLNGLLGALLQKPIKEKDRIIHFLLISALYQIEYMHSPDHAVVNEAVNAAATSKQAWARNLVNGVLRNFLRNKAEVVASLKKPHVIHSFPKFLYDRIGEDWPKQHQAIIQASNQKPPLTLRVNQAKLSRAQYQQELDQNNIDYTVSEQSELGLTLDKPVGVSNIPGFDQGLVSVQDESAQLISSILDIQEDQRVLDGCAAPGGKTCLLLESTFSKLDQFFMVAVDLPHRVDQIHENLNRLKLKAKVIPADLCELESWWDGEPFHKILLDVPCSGSGVIRRHPDIKHRRKAADVEKFAQQQFDLINSAWQVLKPGGLLLYVTCSLLRAENDDVIEKFIHSADGYELQSLPDMFGEITQFGHDICRGS